MLFVEPAPRLHSAADAISFAINSGWTTAGEFCNLIGCSDSTISRWRNEESEPGFNQMCAIVRNHKNPQVQMLFPGVMAATTPIVMSYATAELDVNRDGKVDAHDAVVGLSRAVKSAAEELAALVAKLGGIQGKRRAFSPAEVMSFRASVDAIHCDMSAAARALEHEVQASLRRGGGR